MDDKRPVLSINASDSVARVGVLADARTITAMGGYALAAITSVAVRDIAGISSVYDLPAGTVAGQVRAAISECHPYAIKVGLLRHADTLTAVSRELDMHPRLVMAPGIISSSGQRMIEPDVMRLWEKSLFPQAAVLLLRATEAEAVLGMRIRTDGDMVRAARLLASTGAKSVLLRGCHLADDRLTAYLLNGQEGNFFSSANTEGWQRHGVSSALSSAIATRLAMGDSISQAVHTAHAYMHDQVVYAVDMESNSRRAAYIYNQFMSLIAAHYATDHNVTSYASRLAVTPRYLAVITAQLVGQTPKQIVDSCLTEKAKALLTASRLSIQEVSQRLGFRSQASFCIFFTRLTGQSPLSYRKSH